MRRICLAAALALALCPSTLTALPITLVDTGTPTHGIAYSLNPSAWLAAEFDVAGTYTLTGIDGYIIPFAAGNVTIALYADGGDVPGAQLQQQAFAAAGAENWMGVGGLSWNVGPGTYWVAFTVVSGSTFSGIMREGSPLPLLNEAFSTSQGASWAGADNRDLGIRIFADDAETPAVPEPTSLLLMGTGLLVVVRRARRRYQP